MHPTLLLLFGILPPFLASLLGLSPSPADTTAPAPPIQEQCAVCHVPEGWIPLRDPVQFDHDATTLPLRGVHASLPCRACHTGSTWEQVHDFGSVPDVCWACHRDVHNGSLGGDCERCHRFDSWSLIRAKEVHEAFDFPLVGAHLATDCIGCHPNAGLHQYRQTPNQCFFCHQAERERALATVPGHTPITECEPCHQPTTWAATGTFVHPDFPIRAGTHHGGVECLECHTDNTYQQYNCTITCHFSGCSEFRGNEAHQSVSCPDEAEVACYECHSRG